MKITTAAEAVNERQIRVYPVGDLVIPILPVGLMGGMMGRGMMGGMGMMGRGGMGMGGMGMGGMGMGGMGGMMGGMGMFSVPAETSAPREQDGNAGP
jgi:hypothetical protein